MNAFQVSRGRAGLTRVEVLIVVVVTLTLMALLIPSVQRPIYDSRVARPRIT